MGESCTIARHEALKLDDAAFYAGVINLRPWPEAGAEVAECARCHSTLMRLVAAPAEEVALAG